MYSSLHLVFSIHLRLASLPLPLIQQPDQILFQQPNQIQRLLIFNLIHEIESAEHARIR